MSNEEKVLGKIKSISFGITGYNDMMLGYSIEFSLDGGSRGVITSQGFLDYNRVKHSEHCEWTEQERDTGMINMLKKLSDVLKLAKVDTIDKLKNIPVEVTLEGDTFKSWRVLTEVLQQSFLLTTYLNGVSFFLFINVDIKARSSYT